MIAPEGRKLLFGLLLATIFLGIFGFYHNLSWMINSFRILGILFLFSLNFFRDPVRNVPEGDDLIIAPADGKIVRIQKIDDPDIGQDASVVSIFLNIFNVHVNRVPVTGKVKSASYRQGKFLAAFNHKASDENEQTAIVMTTPKGIIKIKQIAGLIARRIHCYAFEGQEMKKGDRLGFIMFGSRTDIIFPPTVSLQVKEGQKVVGGVTIIGRFA